MSRFTRPLRVSPIPPDGADWCLLERFGYDVKSEGSGDTVEVERGFVTDFASIPRLFWFVLPKWGRYGNAAVVHDYLYWQQERTRKEADGIMKEAMEVLKVPRLQRWSIYWVVRLFGMLAWKRNKLNRKARFPRVIEPTELTAEYPYDRPSLWEEWRRKSPEPEPAEQLPALALFSGKLTEVVAPAVLDPALEGRFYDGSDGSLASDLRAVDLRAALDKLEKAEKRHEKRLEELERRKKRLSRKIDELEKLESPGEPPVQGPGEKRADYQKRLGKHEKQSAAFETAEIELPKKTEEHKRVEVEIQEEEDRLHATQMRWEEKIRQDRDNAILAAVSGLARTSRKAFEDDPAVGFTLALASDRVYETLRPRIRDREAGADTLAVIRSLETFIEDRPEDQIGKIVPAFSEATSLLLPAYRENRKSLNSVMTMLARLPCEEAERHRAESDGLFEEKLDVLKAWRLLRATEALAEDAESTRKAVRIVPLRAMEKVMDGLEVAGLSKILQAWSLLGRGRHGTLGGRVQRLCQEIPDCIAEELGEDDGLIEQGATTRLLVDEAEGLLENHKSMKFLASRGRLQQAVAEQVTRDRRSLWWVLVPLAPAIWFFLRGPMKNLRKFFSDQAIVPDPHPAYLELRSFARRLLLIGGWIYALLALLPATLLYLGWPYGWGAGWRYAVLILLGANFLGGGLHLLRQARKIRGGGRQ